MTSGVVVTELIRLAPVIILGVGGILLITAIARGTVNARVLHTQRPVRVSFAIAALCFIAGWFAGEVLNWYRFAFSLVIFSSLVGLFVVFAQAVMLQQRKAQETGGMMSYTSADSGSSAVRPSGGRPT